jgi:hypothetical protein
LVSKEGMPEKAREIFEQVRSRVPAEFDEGGSIGKRYRRRPPSLALAQSEARLVAQQREIASPLCPSLCSSNF